MDSEVRARERLEMEVVELEEGGGAFRES